MAAAEVVASAALPTARPQGEARLRLEAELRSKTTTTDRATATGNPSGKGRLRVLIAQAPECGLGWELDWRARFAGAWSR